MTKTIFKGRINLDDIFKLSPENQTKFGIALMIKNIGFDLVIDATNAAGEFDTFEFLKELNWEGRYFTLNPSGYGFRPESKKELKMEICKSKRLLDLAIDGRDKGAIDAIIASSVQKHPVYITNHGIGVVLSYYAGKWGGVDLASPRSTEEYSKGIEKSMDLWINSISASRLNHLILTTYVSPGKNYLFDGLNFNIWRHRGHDHGVSLPGITKHTEEIFLQKFREKEWNVRTYDIAQIRHPVNSWMRSTERLYLINRQRDGRESGG